MFENVDFKKLSPEMSFVSGQPRNIQRNTMENTLTTLRNQMALSDDSCLSGSCNGGLGPRSSHLESQKPDARGKLEALGISSSSSKSAAKRAVREGDETLKCITCWAEYDTFPQLRKHLTKRKHMYSKTEFKAEWTEWVERVGERKEDPEAWSLAESNTYFSLLWRSAHLVTLSR